MSDEIVIDGEQYISSKRAAEISAYTQDYIGQLARGSQIQARRVGGLWYIARASLDAHKEKADQYKPVPPPPPQTAGQDSFLSFDGKTYVSAAYAGKLTGYSPDYVGQLARAGTVLSRQVGNRWFVERQAILTHKESKDALLAAVQADSVGIPRENSILRSRASAYTESFYTYTKDTRELLPPVNEQVELANANEEHAIPIRIIPTKMFVSDDKQMVRATSRMLPAPSRLLIAAPIAALTVVIVISFGFSAIKDSSLYTKSAAASQSAAVNVSESLKNITERIAQQLEVFLAPEIVYRRGEN